jgi:ATP-dependent helicase/nuclease subunit A
MQFTSEQQAAIGIIDRNVIVTAGAGSGKTSVLVTRFMHLLEQNPDWNLLNIVAITFTEKAAREMRERIRAAIRAKIGLTDISEQERQRWQSLENQLDSARISTIHGLCSRMLRANPVEAALDPRFEVLDEVDAATLQDDVIEFAMGTAVDRGETWTELLPLYEVRTVRRILKSFIGLGWLDDLLHEDFDSATLWESWENLRQQVNEQAVQSIINDREFIHTLNAIQGPFPQGDKLTPSCDLVVKKRDILENGSLQDAVLAINELVNDMNLRGGSAGNWGGKEVVDAIKDDLKTIRKKAQDALKRLYPPLATVDEIALEYVGYWRDAILSVRQTYQQAKNDRQSLDFDDLEQKTMQLLRDYRAVSERYNHPDYGEFKHIMVDEFQDTNDAQRQIVYALCGIDKGTSQPGKLFVVGDPKQSIYAFRGADVSVFQQVRDEITAASGEPVNLSRSFRTHDRLVQAFNRIFDAIMQREDGLARGYSVEFAAMDANRPSEELDHQPVHIITIPKPDDVENWKAEDGRRWEAVEIGRHIKNMVDNDVPVYNKRKGIYQPITYDDVAILFRAMTNVNLYEDAFQQMGIPYLTVAGRGYFDQQEIYDLRNLLRALHNPADDLALAAALRSPLFNFSDDLLLALRLRTNKKDDRYPMSLWTALFWDKEPLPHWVDLPAGEVIKVAFAQEVLDVLHAMAGRVTIGELLNQALDLTGFEATLISLENGIRRRANVLKFLDVARDSQRVSLGSFNAYLADLVAAQAREGEAPLEPEGTVTLMTVHKSKGLEFPVIVLADASYSGRNISDPVMLTNEFGIAPNTPAMEDEKPFIYELTRQFRADQEFAESKRLFYVGATRAQDYLVISGQDRTRRGSWMYWLMDDLEIDDSWPDVSIYEPVEVPQEIREETSSASGWDVLDRTNAPQGKPVEIAPLLKSTPQYIPPIRHVSASHLEILGRVKDNRSVLRPEDFRRRVLRGAPPPIKPIVHDVDPTDIPAYVTGNIVHRALQVRLYREHDVDEILRGYAWDEGLTRHDSIEEAVHQAKLLLEHYWGSEIHQWLAEAETIRQEIAFVFRKVDYLIHGIIDTLIYHEGRWKVIDYKTDKTSAQYVSRAARQYLYQMGAYAEAVHEMTGELPEVHLYFLRPQVRYQIPESDWQQAIDTLNFEIDELLMENV